MTIKGFWHICLINQWEEIVKEQLTLMIRSGLYDRSMVINIGAVGSEEEKRKLGKIIIPYQKLFLKVYSTNLNDYEFITLKMLWDKSNKDIRFYGFYIHTKGVSYPNHEGGKYWLDYMNYYNITKWKDCINRLNNGYDTCGVKYLTSPKIHYSGNFWWFKSMYSRNLKDPMTLNKKDRFDAEMWIGLNNPNAATLCQLFVDYNTKGKFQIQKETNMPKNYVHTLAYNLPSEVEKTTKLIYEQNNPEDFKHIICDLGFPIIKGDEIPGNFSGARQVNTEKLKEICIKYGSTYLKMENIGVSQNWTQIINHCKLKDDDVIIGADPDERTMDNGWINAMAKVLRSGKIGMVSLMMPEQVKEMPRWSYQNFSIDGVWAIELNGGINWALIGFKGEFLKKMGDL